MTTATATATRPPIELSFSREDDAIRDSINLWDFFDTDTGEYLGPCPMTGNEVLLDGQPIPDGWVLPTDLR